MKMIAASIMCADSLHLADELKKKTNVCQFFTLTHLLNLSTTHILPTYCLSTLLSTLTIHFALHISIVILSLLLISYPTVLTPISSTFFPSPN
ncbi:hypothetical protein C7U73_28245, partial [Escherichia coli]|uniref:hypothetical protein n=1 Tax=Escherichia coli TaxID=562 RepID=UPI000D47195D